MDIMARCDDEVKRDFVRELLISISYTMPDKDPKADVPPSKVPIAKVLTNGDLQTEKCISELISISNNECPGVDMSPGGTLPNRQG